jgi:hypothetical protein
MSTLTNGQHESEILIDVLRDSINKQHEHLDRAFAMRDRTRAMQTTDTLLVLYQVLHDMEGTCDKYGFYY